MAKIILTAGKTYFVMLREATTNAGFYDEACQEFYLRRLLHCLTAYQVQLHAYSLQQKEILLLATPMTPTGLNSLLKFLNRSYSSYFGKRFSRPVRVWSDFPLICKLPSHKLVLDSQKYIERYALRSGEHCHPGEYRYSSYCSNAFTRNSEYLSPHPAYSNFLNSQEGLFSGYRQFVGHPFSQAYCLFLDSRLLFGRPLLSSKNEIQLENTEALTNKKINGAIALVSDMSGDVPYPTFP